MLIHLKIASAALLVSAGIASAQTAPSAPVVSYPSASAVSPPLSDLPNEVQTPNGIKLVPAPKRLPPRGPGPGGKVTGDEALQRQPGPTGGNHTKATFPGIGANGYVPPDPNIAVGPLYVVQMVNSQMAVYDKSGTLLKGPVSLSSLWSGLAPCSSSNAGDPIVQYDVVADRWLVTELGSATSAPYSECIAVSTSGDPRGSYHLYTYKSAGPTGSDGGFLNDYPKFGVWPTPDTSTNTSTYLASYNLFDLTQPASSQFQGANLCAYDRAGMISGATSPAEICFRVPAANPGSFLPADLDGAKPGSPSPLSATPAYFLNLATSSSLGLWEIDSLNFSPTPPGPPTGTLVHDYPLTDISVAGFVDACSATGTCVVQPGSQQLDSLGDRLMYRFAYRIFSDHAAMVVNHSITAGSSVGVRWYELRQTPAAGFYLYQQGTFAPDSAYRWMGSAAMDGAGNIAIGYSKSSSSIYPSIAVASRLSTDPLNQIGSEQVFQTGTAVQTIYSRWGDYTALRIDPSDDKTFWYTSEYYTSGCNFFFGCPWKTAIDSFQVGVSGPDFSLPALGSLTVMRGTSKSETVTVSAVNGSNNVSLSIGGLPSRTSGSFNPPAVSVTGTSSGYSTLTITAGSRTTRATYNLTITGNNGSTSHTIPLTLIIN